MNVLAKFHDYSPAQQTFYEDVVSGLQAAQKQLPCKYFYDERGSQLFEQICALDEYYPTRTELKLLEECGEDIAQRIGAGAELIEFGCGSLQKVRLLLAAMHKPGAFIPIDISREHLLVSAANLATAFPDLEILPVCADYTQPITIPDTGVHAKRVGFFPGSTIGNFERADAIEFLIVIAEILGPAGELVIGVDLKKDTDILHAAYNDKAGVTAAFNLNLLARINRELGANFDLTSFRHNAFYAAETGRVEMHLESLNDQQVKIGGECVEFVAGETIHTENCHKYYVEEFQALASEAGFKPVDIWVDKNDLFSIHYLRVCP